MIYPEFIYLAEAEVVDWFCERHLYREHDLIEVYRRDATVRIAEHTGR
jgi:hypothetical protein